jgi:hypothetical protein
MNKPSRNAMFEVRINEISPFGVIARRETKRALPCMTTYWQGGAEVPENIF